MNRRKFLAGAAIGVTAGLAGCTGSVREQWFGDDDDGPGVYDESGSRDSDGSGDDGDNIEQSEGKSVIESFYQSMYAGDVEAVNEILHDDSPLGMYTEQQLESISGDGYEIVEFELLEGMNNAERVEFVLVTSDERGNETDVSVTVELQYEGSDLKIWDVELGGSGNA